MQQVTVDGARWQQDSDGAWLALRVKSPQTAMDVCDALKPGKEYNVTIKGKGRSLDANAYCWVQQQHGTEPGHQQRKDHQRSGDGAGGYVRKREHHKEAVQRSGIRREEPGEIRRARWAGSRHFRRK